MASPEQAFLAALRIDKKNGVPIYVQLLAQIKTLIGTVVHAGDRLPTLRDVSVQLAIDQQTVAKAYKTLETEGMIEMRRRHGTIVSGPVMPVDPAVEAEKITDLAKQTILTAQTMGLNPALIGQEIIRLTGDQSQ